MERMRLHSDLQPTRKLEETEEAMQDHYVDWTHIMKLVSQRMS
jgi:hypothetical protein